MIIRIAKTNDPTAFSFSRRAKNIIVKNLVLLSWKKDFLKTRSTCFGTKDRRKEDWRSKVRKGIETKRGHNKWNGPFPYHCCNYPASSDLTSPHGINIPIFFFFFFFPIDSVPRRPSDNQHPNEITPRPDISPSSPPPIVRCRAIILNYHDSFL